MKEGIWKPGISLYYIKIKTLYTLFSDLSQEYVFNDERRKRKNRQANANKTMIVQTAENKVNEKPMGLLKSRVNSGQTKETKICKDMRPDDQTRSAFGKLQTMESGARP